MSLGTQPGDVVSKGAFAHLCGVSPGRVSQWLSEGKISGAALVGEGPKAQIRVSVAAQQLDRRLDTGQRFGNGLGTRLPLDLAPPPPRAPADSSPPQPPGASTAPPALAAAESVTDKIALAKLEQLERANREGARQEAIAAGRLTDANDVKQLVGREISRLLTRFEGALADFASALAAKFQIPQRDALHLLRAEFNRARAGLAAESRAAAEAMPEHLPYAIDDAPEATGADEDADE